MFSCGPIDYREECTLRKKRVWWETLMKDMLCCYNYSRRTSNVKSGFYSDWEMRIRAINIWFHENFIEITQSNIPQPLFLECKETRPFKAYFKTISKNRFSETYLENNQNIQWKFPKIKKRWYYFKYEKLFSLCSHCNNFLGVSCNLALLIKLITKILQDQESRFKYHGLSLIENLIQRVCK